MNYRTKAIPVTATQWFREGDHPAVTGCTRRWATAEDPTAIVTDREFAEQYDKLGMVHTGFIERGDDAAVPVEAGDWIVEEEGEAIEVYTDALFQRYFEALGAHETPAAAPVVVQAVVTSGPVDGEGAPAPVSEVQPASPEAPATPVVSDPAPVDPSPAPAQ